MPPPARLSLPSTALLKTWAEPGRGDPPFAPGAPRPAAGTRRCPFPRWHPRNRSPPSPGTRLRPGRPRAAQGQSGSTAGCRAGVEKGKNAAWAITTPPHTHSPLPQPRAPKLPATPPVRLPELSFPARSGQRQPRLPEAGAGAGAALPGGGRASASPAVGPGPGPGPGSAVGALPAPLPPPMSRREAGGGDDTRAMRASPEQPASRSGRARYI